MKPIWFMSVKLTYIHLFTFSIFMFQIKNIIHITINSILSKYYAKKDTTLVNARTTRNKQEVRLVLCVYLSIGEKNPKKWNHIQRENDDVMLQR